MEILYIILPALLVLATAYLLIDKQVKSEEKRRNFEIQKANLSTLTPIRLRAYERLALFLERTTPNAMIVGMVHPEMNNIELQAKLLETIRQEYSHNISQQIYVSHSLWEAILAAKESLIQLVNVCATHCEANAPASQLAERVIKAYAASEITPTEIALAELKEEVKTYF